MKKVIIKSAAVAFISVFLSVNGWAQPQKQPDVKVDVKKQLDDKGNVTGYDSVYSFSWSGNNPVNLDSLLQIYGFSPFHDDFFGVAPKPLIPGTKQDSSEYGNQPEEHFGMPFDPFGDSAFDFFNDPFFSHSFADPQKMMEEHMRMMNEMMKQFDLSMPEFREYPDSVPEPQQYSPPKKSQPKGQEI